MLPRADTLGTRPATAAVEAPLPVAAGTDARQEVYHRLAQIPLGQQLTAEVLKQLDDGTFLIRIANTQARMVLPNGTQVGDSLLMTKLASEPRPVFLLDGEASSSPAQLSQAGRLITALLKIAEQQNSPTAVSGKAPLLAARNLLAAAEGSLHLSAALHEALASSGLFYESHLEDWISGSRTISELAGEPQSRFTGTSSAPRPDTTGFSHAEAAQLLAQLRQWVGSERLPITLLRDASQGKETTANTDADTAVASFGPDASAARMDPTSVKMIHQQLYALENRQVAWHGELWPGHRIEWEVSEEKHPRSRPDESPPAWHSTVRFRLPHLGEISASLHLAGDKVGIDVQTQSAQATTLLLTHRNTLAEALDAAGSPLDYLQVKQDEET